MANLSIDATVVAERPGARAKVRFVRMSASKVRVVMNLIRGKRVEEALEILQFTERLAAQEVAKALRSAIANAEHNEQIPASELYVSVAFADEGPTIKRFRPRARGRAGRINKQTCHLTIEVSRMTETELDELRSIGEAKAKNRQGAKKPAASAGGDRAARVAKSKAAAETDDDVEAPSEDSEPTDSEEVAAEATSDDATSLEEPSEAEEVDDADEATSDAGEEE